MCGFLSPKYRLILLDNLIFCQEKIHIVICLTRFAFRWYWRLSPLPVILFCDDWRCLRLHYTAIQDITVLSACWLKLPSIYFLFSLCRCVLLPSNLCLGRCINLTYYACPLVGGEGQRDGSCTSRGRIFKTGKPLVFKVRVNRDAAC